MAGDKRHNAVDDEDDDGAGEDEDGGGSAFATRARRRTFLTWGALEGSVSGNGTGFLPRGKYGVEVHNGVSTRVYRFGPRPNASWMAETCCGSGAVSERIQHRVEEWREPLTCFQ